MPGRGKLLMELLKSSGTQPSAPRPGHHGGTTRQAEGMTSDSGATGDSQTTGASSSGSEREDTTTALGTAPQQSKPNVLDEDKLVEAIKAVNARQHKNDDDFACLENWDPMAEDFKCPDFNSYDNGPGKDLPLYIQRPVEGQKPKEERKNELYVTGIPRAMSEDGLRNLFARAGKVVHVRKMQSKFTDRPDTFGFVQLSDVTGVENAVRMIDNLEVEGCVMHVRIAISYAEREARRKKREPLQYKLADEHDDNEDDGDDLVIGDDDMPEGDDTNTTGAAPAAATDDVTTAQTAALPSGDSSLGAIREVTAAPTPGGSTIKAPLPVEALAAARPKEPAPVSARPKQPAPTSVRPKEAAPVKPPEEKRARKKVERRPCMLCGMIATRQCSKCFGPYCGAKCQQEDWLKHKFICQKPANKFEERFMIEDDEVTDFMNDVVDHIRIDESALRRETLPIGKPIPVTLTDVRSPSDFSLVKSQNLAVLEELKTTMNQKLSSRQPGDDYHPQVGDVCAAPYQGDWYRALIELMPPASKEAVVTFVDYGNKEAVAVTDLAKLPPAMVGVATQAVPCSLGVEPVCGPWCERSLELLVEAVYTEGARHCATMLLARKDRNIVDITQGVDGLNIADRLVSEGIAKKIPVLSTSVATPLRTDITPSTEVTQCLSTHPGTGDVGTATSLLMKPAGAQPSVTTPPQPQPPPRTQPLPPTQPSPPPPHTAAPPSPHTAAPPSPHTAAPPSPHTAAPPSPHTAAPPSPHTAAPPSPHTAAPPSPHTAAPPSPHTPPQSQQRQPSPNTPPMTFSPAGSHLGSGDADTVPRAATSRGGSTSPVQPGCFIKKRTVRSGDQLKVVVVHVDTLDEFWVQVGDASDDFTRMMVELQGVYAAKKLKTGFRCPGHNLVAAFSPMYGMWFRGHVIKYDTARVHVFSVDYGNEDWIDFAHVHSLEGAFCTVPAQAMACRLESNIPRTDVTLACFQKYVDAALLECQVLREASGSYVVDLHDPKKPSSLCVALLNQTGRSPGTHTPQTQPRTVSQLPSPSPTSAPTSALTSAPTSAQTSAPTAASVTKSPSVMSSPHPDTVVMAASLTRSAFPATSNEHKVIVTDPTSYDNIVVIDVNNSESFDMFLDQICIELDNYSGSYRPKTVGELVFVREATCGWSRAEVLTIGPTDSARVKMLDTNKLTRVKFTEIAAVHPKIKQPPVQAIRCVLWNMAGMAPGASWEADVIPQFDVSQVMRAVVKVPGDPCHVELYREGTGDSLNTTLARDGLTLLTVPHTTNTTAGRSQPPQGALAKNQSSPGLTATKLSPHASKISPQPQRPNLSLVPKSVNPKSPEPANSNKSLPGVGASSRELSVGALSGGGQQQQFRTQRPKVTVCHVEDPGSFYCHWNDESVKKTFEEEESAFREDMVNGRRHHGAPAVASLKPGGIIAALSPANNTWYRAEVLETNFHGTDKVWVRLVDYGSKDLVPSKCVRLLPETHQRLPYQAIHCGFPMWDPVKSPNPGAATDITKMVLGNNEFDLSLDGFEDGKYRVIDMRAPDTPTSLIRESGPMQRVLQMQPVTTEMVAAETTPPVKPVATVSRETMPAEFVGEVSHTYSLDNFYVQGKDMAELDALQERLNTYCQQAPPTVFNPGRGQICCAKFSGDGLWYRARVVEPDVEGKCHVLFMDFGNSEAVQKTNLRRCTPAFTQLPPKAFRCTLHDLSAPVGGWRDCDIKLFVEALLGGPCHFTRRSAVSDVNHVTILHPIHGDIATLLRNKGVGTAPLREITLVQDSLKIVRENEALKQQIAAMSARR